jgi:hypothetical protein
LIDLFPSKLITQDPNSPRSSSQLFCVWF